MRFDHTSRNAAHVIVAIAFDSSLREAAANLPHTTNAHILCIPTGRYISTPAGPRYKVEIELHLVNDALSYIAANPTKIFGNVIDAVIIQAGQARTEDANALQRTLPITARRISIRYANEPEQALPGWEKRALDSPTDLGGFLKEIAAVAESAS